MSLAVNEVLHAVKEYLQCRILSRSGNHQKSDIFPVVAAIADTNKTAACIQNASEKSVEGHPVSATDDTSSFRPKVLIDVTIQRDYPLTLISREYGMPFGRLRSDPETIISDSKLLHACKWNIGVHIAEFEANMLNEIFADSKKLSPVVSVLSTGIGNILQNKRSVAYLHRQKLYCVEGEDLYRLPPYCCLVQTTGWNISIELLRISETGSCTIFDKDIWNQKKQCIPSRRDTKDGIKWAVSGYPLILNGKLASISEIASNASDLRHIWQLPKLENSISNRLAGLTDNKAEFYFGFDRLTEKDYFSRAVSGEPLEFSTEMSLDDNWIDTLCKVAGFTRSDLIAKTKGLYQPKRGFVLDEKDLALDFCESGYQMVEDKSKISKEGDFCIEFQKKCHENPKIYLKLLPAIYPHHIVGISKCNRVVNISISGLSGRSGITIENAQKLCQALEFTDALIFDNGFDVVSQIGGHNGTVIRHLQNTRQTRLTASLHFGRTVEEVTEEIFGGYCDGFQLGYCTFEIPNSAITDNPFADDKNKLSKSLTAPRMVKNVEEIQNATPATKLGRRGKQSPVSV